MKKLFPSLIIICLSLISYSAYSQGGEGNIWYFGTNAGLDFNGGPPVALLDGQLSTSEGCATICDPSGNLLFYTDGIVVYNAIHSIMTNSLNSSPGGDLNGSSSATQSGVIVPVPQSTQFYVIFTVDANVGSGGCCFSVVNMNAAGGYGNVILANKNSLLFNPTSEKITAVNHATSSNIWVITHPWNSGEFWVYSVTPTGVNQTPVISNVGAFYSGLNAVTRGYLQASPDGSYVAAGIEGLDKYELFDFDASTGQLTTFISMNANYDDAYGVEFSPDGTILYGSERWGTPVYQWNLASGLPGQIMASQTQIATLGSSNGGALQLAPDGKIYLARYSQQYLGVINFPNTLLTNLD